MYPSIFSNVITGQKPLERAERTASLGLQSVQFVPKEVSVGFGFDPSGTAEITDDFAEWAAAYASSGVEICAVAGYLNLLARDQDRRAANIAVFTSYLRRMHQLGTRLISTETGSLAVSGDWDDDPENHTPSSWDAFRRVVEDLVVVAEAEDVVILLEPYIVNVCNTPQLGAGLVAEFDSPHLGICMDPTNFFTNELARPERVRETMIAGFEAERDWFRLAHAKQVVPPAPGSPKPGLPGPGAGLIDYPLYLDLLASAGYTGPLVIEHLTEAEVPAALRFVQDQIAGQLTRVGGDA